MGTDEMICIPDKNYLTDVGYFASMHVYEAMMDGETVTFVDANRSGEVDLGDLFILRKSYPSLQEALSSYKAPMECLVRSFRDKFPAEMKGAAIYFGLVPPGERQVARAPTHEILDTPPVPGEESTGTVLRSGPTKIVDVETDGKTDGLFYTTADRTYLRVYQRTGDVSVHEPSGDPLGNLREVLQPFDEFLAPSLLSQTEPTKGNTAGAVFFLPPNHAELVYNWALKPTSEIDLGRLFFSPSHKIGINEECSPQYASLVESVSHILGQPDLLPSCATLSILDSGALQAREIHPRSGFEMIYTIHPSGEVYMDGHNPRSPMPDLSRPSILLPDAHIDPDDLVAAKVWLGLRFYSGRTDLGVPPKYWYYVARNLL